MNELLAKSTGETLLDHTINVVESAKKVCKSLPLYPYNDERDDISSILVKVGIMHDIGKSAVGFQNLLKEKKTWGHRHEIISTGVTNVIFPDLPKEALFAIITHHRNLPKDITTEKKEKCLPSTSSGELPFDSINPSWESMTKEWIQNWIAVKELLLKLFENYNIKTNLPLEFEFRGIGLSEEILTRDYQKKESEFDRKYASLLRGILMTADHIASAHQFDLPEVPIHKDYISTIKRHELNGYEILPFQKRCSEILGDAILKAPTGSGKTAAILLWAANNQVENGRLFYVLPYTASINAMYKRLQEIYYEKNVGILHHKNAEYLFNIFENDNSSYDAAQMAESLSGLARELYHPIRVTTPHQILRVALQGKGWELGLAEFPNACFVFDEIHTFEPLFVGLTIATVKWLKDMGAKVLFASATLPLFLEEILQKEIGITNIISPDSQIHGDKDVLDKIRHNIEIRGGNLYSNIDDIIKEIKNSEKTTLIICNHVDTSRKIYEKFKECFDINEIKLFHSRFNSADRFNIETAIQSKNPPKILIATQAIEVSLDLDYDCGYIEPAPADALGQRLGRINRKGSRNTPAKVIIFEEPSLKSKGNPFYLPYDEEITKKTINCLRIRKSDLLSEQQLTDIVNEIYKDGYTGSSKEYYERGLNNSAIKTFNKNIIAGTYKPWIQDVIEGTDGSLEILPFELYEDFSQFKREKRYLKAKSLLVPIQISQSSRLFKEKILRFDEELGEYVANLEYSSDTGLDISKQTENIY